MWDSNFGTQAPTLNDAATRPARASTFSDVAVVIAGIDFCMDIAFTIAVCFDVQGYVRARDVFAEPGARITDTAPLTTDQSGKAGRIR